MTYKYLFLQKGGDYMRSSHYNSELMKIVDDWRYAHSILFGKGFQELLNKRNTCFHYTTLDSFWKIIEDDLFHAMNVRFSNDDQEYLEGEKIIRNITKKSYNFKEDYYVICFCKDGNLLSQWREYGKTGVSIGMDFSRELLFTILKNSTDDAENLLQFAIPIDVHYSKEIGKKLQLLHLKSPSDFSTLNHMRCLVPYIKHHAFREEKEARLLFSLSKIDEYKNVFYKTTLNYMKPYIAVKYGLAKEKEQECTYVDIGDNVNEEFIEYIQQAVNEFNTKKTANVRLNKRTENENVVYISDGINQKTLWYMINGAIKHISNRPEIWCDGHWPIRSITVGPTLDQEIIKESIEHYCHNVYWLSNVKVKKSDTPYREKRDK